MVAAGGDFELVQREFPDPGPGQVRIRVQACGVCHSDSVTKFGLFPGIQYPRVPGHEVAGVLDAVGRLGCQPAYNAKLADSNGSSKLSNVEVKRAATRLGKVHT